MELWNGHFLESLLSWQWSCKEEGVRGPQQLEMPAILGPFLVHAGRFLPHVGRKLQKQKYKYVKSGLKLNTVF